MNTGPSPIDEKETKNPIQNAKTVESSPLFPADNH
jgi:hypothetical protein